MRTSSLLLAPLLVAAPLAAAFKDTAPILAFASQPSDLLEALRTATSQRSSPATSPRDFIKAVVEHVDEICKFDAVALVEVPNLEAASFHRLPSHSSLRARSLSAPSQLVLPHVVHAPGSTHVGQELQSAISRSCPGWITHHADGANSHEVVEEGKILFRMKVESDNGLERNDEALARQLANLEDYFPNHLVLVTAAGAHPHPQLSKREKSPSAVPTVDPNTGLLHRYSFFTTGLLMALLVIGGLITPICLFAVKLLSDIQTPDRLGAQPRGNVGSDRKNQ